MKHPFGLTDETLAETIAVVTQHLLQTEGAFRAATIARDVGLNRRQVQYALDKMRDELVYDERGNAKHVRRASLDERVSMVERIRKQAKELTDRADRLATRWVEIPVETEPPIVGANPPLVYPEPDE